MAVAMLRGLALLVFGCSAVLAANDNNAPICPVTANASSTQTESKALKNLIDGSGLSETSPGSGVWVHSNDAFRDRGVERGTMWCSGAVHGEKEITATVTFDLGKPYRIGSLRVWNYNEANWTNAGMREVEVLASSDGKTFQSLGVTLLLEAPGDNDYEGQLVSLQRPTEARHFRLHCLSNWGGERSGLSEIRFYTSGAGVPGCIVPGVKAQASAGPVPNRPNAPRPAVPGAENIVFPANSGVIDVTAAPYNAKGNGVADDTRAIQQALNDYPAKGTIIYLPNGVYLVSRTLRWGKDQRLTTLQGQSRAGTIVRLKDNCSGFGDPARPRAMVWTGGTPAQRFRNQIRNLTWDVGRNNPGAIGVQFDASNCGCLRDVDIRSSDTGIIGLDMAYADDFGPCFVQNVRVFGFDTGIATKYGVASVCFEHVTLENQRRVGWVNDGQPITVRKLFSNNRVTAVRQHNWGGLFTIIDGQLAGSGNASDMAAIELKAGGMYLRNVQVSGYAAAVEKSEKARTERIAAADILPHWASTKLPGTAPRGVELPVKETPEVPYDPLAGWAVVTDFGAKLDGHTDDSEALQRAIDSGKTTVCLPRGQMAIKKPVVLRGNVRRLLGCETFLKFPSPITDSKNIFTVGESKQPILVVERIGAWFWDNQSKANFIDNPTNRTLVLRDLNDLDDTTDQNRNGRGTVISGPGELFVEDVAGRFHIMPGVKAWMRFVNPETNQDGRTTTLAAQWHLKNEGGQLWALGTKTEGPGPVLITTRGGTSEILGGLMYSSGGARTQDQPAFVVEDSRATMVMSEANFSNNAYKSLIRVLKGGKVKYELLRGQTPGIAGGSMITFWSTE
ncbi:MAG: glycosyl hydrolase family 28-related protein [Thermoguttaceae bacterium]